MVVVINISLIMRTQKFKVIELLIRCCLLRFTWGIELVPSPTFQHVLGKIKDVPIARALSSYSLWFYTKNAEVGPIASLLSKKNPEVNNSVTHDDHILSDEISLEIRTFEESTILLRIEGTNKDYMIVISFAIRKQNPGDLPECPCGCDLVIGNLWPELVIVLVLIKIIIWSCVCYTRSKRLRTAQQRIIIVQSPQAAMTGQVHDQHGIIHHEHIPSIHDTYGGITNPQIATFAPPSYDDVVRTPLEATKPPSYEQVIKEHQQIGATQEHGSK